MTPEQTLDWLADQHFDQCKEKRPAQDWIRKMKSMLPASTQEPVAYRVWGRMGGISFRHTKPHESEYVEWDELYTAPPAAQRQWVGLTDEEIEAVWKVAMFEDNGRHALLDNQPFVHFARAIEAKLKEKNG